MNYIGHRPAEFLDAAVCFLLQVFGHENTERFLLSSLLKDNSNVCYRTWKYSSNNPAFKSLYLGVISIQLKYKNLLSGTPIIICEFGKKKSLILYFHSKFA